MVRGIVEVEGNQERIGARGPSQTPLGSSDPASVRWMHPAFPEAGGLTDI